MKFLITYDISSPKRWRKIFKILKNTGLNVQLSCFEVDMDRGELDKLVIELQKLIDWEEDSIYFFPISDYASGMGVKFGKNEEINESKVI
jgi:CRISPR-associated protein Cas2